MTSSFLDSNVLIYAFTSDERAERALELLGGNNVTSVQGLNEFAHVARRKLRMEWAELRQALDAIKTLCRTILPLDLATHEAALRIAERHGYGVYDSLIVASALGAGCDVLWSEDMQDGIVIGDKLRIANPFSPPPLFR